MYLPADRRTIKSVSYTHLLTTAAKDASDALAKATVAETAAKAAGDAAAALLQ